MWPKFKELEGFSKGQSVTNFRRVVESDCETNFEEREIEIFVVLRSIVNLLRFVIRIRLMSYRERVVLYKKLTIRLMSVKTSLHAFFIFRTRGLRKDLEKGRCLRL